MSLLHKPLDQIEETDLQQLVDNEITEGRLLDYKEQLPGDSGDAKRELLYDVTSFANAAGGEIIFGISEKRIENQSTGIANALLGVQVENTDAYIRKLESLIRDGVNPRIYGVQCKFVHLTNGRQVLIIRVPQSMNAPHMVTISGVNRFLIRNSAGKHPMDIGELRSAFLMQGALREKIARFRLERLSKIVVNEVPFPLSDKGHYLVVHVIPLSSFGDHLLNVEDMKRQSIKLFPLGINGFDTVINFDGFMTYASRANVAYTYTQFYRSGIIEAVNSSILSPSPEKIIPTYQVEDEIIEKSYKYMEVLAECLVRPPYIIMPSLLQVNGFSVSPSHSFRPVLIFKDDLLLPEVVIEVLPSNKEKLADLMKHSLDVIWNAGGLIQSDSYNDKGQRVRSFS